MWIIEGGIPSVRRLTFRMSYVVNQIFVEKHNDPAKVRYTWGPTAIGPYPSLYQLYMEMEDVTEWEFAMAYIGSWEIWQNIVQAKWFQPIISRWRKELELKLKARHLRQIKELAEGTGKDKLTANKYLLDKGYTFEDQPKRGRPSKTEIAEKANQIAEFEKETNEDLNRISTSSREDLQRIIN
jgi:hypothetical protein